MHGVSKDIELLKKVEYLNGFLYGISISNGEINQFFGRFFLLEKNGLDELERINDFLSPGGGFQIEKEEKVANSLEIEKRLELGLRSFLVINPLGDTSEVESIVEDRKKYISFKIMDMLDFMGVRSIDNMLIIDAHSESYRAKFFILKLQDYDAVFFFSKRNKQKYAK